MTERDNLEDLGGDGRIILKRNFTTLISTTARQLDAEDNLEDLGGDGRIILKRNFTTLISTTARQIDAEVWNHMAGLLLFPTIVNLRNY